MWIRTLGNERRRMLLAVAVCLSALHSGSAAERDGLSAEAKTGQGVSSVFENVRPSTSALSQRPNASPRRDTRLTEFNVPAVQGRPKRQTSPNQRRRLRTIGSLSHNKAATSSQLVLTGTQPRRGAPHSDRGTVTDTLNTNVRPMAPDLTDRLQVIQYDNVSLADAMKLFSEETGHNVICSAAAGTTQINAYLRDVTPLDALEAIVKANGLFFRIDEKSKIVRISTAEEYEKDLTNFREEQTRVFTLLYPNPVAVAQVIAHVYGDVVELNTADSDIEDLVDLSQRFNRFDMVDERSLGLGTFDANESTESSLSRTTGSFPGGALQAGSLPFTSGLTDRSRRRPRMRPRDPSLDQLPAAEIQNIENQLAASGQLSESDRTRLMRRGGATIFVSTIRRNNQVVVRTGDSQSMAEIAQLITQLDVPTPTVLLEVKVLRIALADGVNSAFEYFVGNDEVAASFSDGDLAPNFPGANPSSRIFSNGLGVSGSVPGSLTFQVVDSNFQFRMQLLESESRVTALATPLILTANNEVSRIFVGDTLPFTVGFTPSQVVGGFNSVAGAVAATPITELRDVGQSLLITPSINADRTVTLRVVEENSERVLGGASIPVPDVDGSGVTPVHVDTVRRRTVSGTVVAQDGMAVALGGLIEEHVAEARDQAPILGSIPGIGFLFRRESASSSRSELIVMIRPYVFNTPSESAATTQTVIDELSMHPNSQDAAGNISTYLPCQTTDRSDSECWQRAELFRFHNATTPQ